MWKRLIVALIATITINATGQQPDGYDTLFCRGSNYILVPRYDTLKQLNAASQKSDSIIAQLENIAGKLGIKDTIK